MKSGPVADQAFTHGESTYSFEQCSMQSAKVS